MHPFLLHSFHPRHDCVCYDPMTVRLMREEDWHAVSEIFREGLETGVATFQREVPSYEQWNASYSNACRLVVEEDATVVGWAALSPVSSRAAYRGVGEVSIYIAKAYRGRRIGCHLLQSLISSSEQHGYWTLQAVVLVDNTASIALHTHCGFRIVGYREKIGQLADRTWSDTLLMERRSTVVGLHS